MCCDMGPPTANRGAYGAKNWPLFPSPMTLQLCNWVEPILSPGFCMASKTAFLDLPQPHWGPLWPQNGVFGGRHGKMQTTQANPCPLATFDILYVLWLHHTVWPLQPFSQWPLAIFGHFPKRVLAPRTPKRGLIAFLLKNTHNHLAKGSSGCIWPPRHDAPSG